MTAIQLPYGQEVQGGYKKPDPPCEGDGMQIDIDFGGKRGHAKNQFG